MRKQAEAEAKQAALLKEIGKGNEDIEPEPPAIPGDTNNDGKLSFSEQKAMKAAKDKENKRIQGIRDREERMNSGIAGGNAYAGEKSEDGKTITAATGTFPVETAKRGDNDVLSQTVKIGKKRYRVFRDSNGDLYAVKV
jgi:hypothetical protein